MSWRSRAQRAARRRGEQLTPAEEINAIVAELAPVAESIREIEACNVALATKTVANVIAIAKYLGGTRSHLPHGEWGPWLAREFKWSARTGARYWSVY